MDEKSKGSLFFLQLPNDLASLLGVQKLLGLAVIPAKCTRLVATSM
jgi:hypothetical protein